MSQQINLIDPALRVKRDWLAGRLIVGVACLLGLLIGSHGLYEKTLLDRTIATSLAQATPAEPDTVPQDASLQEALDRVARGERLLQALSGMTDLPRNNAQRLRNLIAALPENMWLQEVELTSGRGLRVVGGTTEATALTRFSARLGTQQDFQGSPLFVFKVEPRAVPKSGDVHANDNAAPEQEPASHYSFVLSTHPNEMTP
jgi:hypothetical protein